MNLLATTRLALQQLLAARTRSFLTMLGVIIGVAALVALTSIVSGATSGVTSSLAGLGGNNIIVSGQFNNYLTDADEEAIAELPGVVGTAGQTSYRGTVSNGSNETDATLVGVTPSYQEVLKPALASGSFLPGWPEAGASRTAAISLTVADDLGLTAEDVGGTITVAGSDFLLAGILDDATGFGAGGSVYVPLGTARSMFAATPYLGTITVVVDDADNLNQIQSTINAMLRVRHSLSIDDEALFSVTNLTSVLGTVQTIQSMLSLLLGGIASISLVVGGIGIMNIMLVSVRERTAEIGIRRAIGAKRNQILAQFLIEATVLSVAGGVLGLGLGLIASAIVASIGGWAFTISAATIGLAFGFSFLVGIVFGAWPARTAARMQPVEALRHE